jgi:prepilin-type N-terminal cleavage/methylation domain-containing protein
MRRENGFSLLEVLAVLAILLVIGAMVTPYMITATAMVRLRGGVNSLSGIFQESRAVAIKQNRLMSTRFTLLGDAQVAYVKDPTLTGSEAAFEAIDPQISMGAPVRRVIGLASYTGAPPALDVSKLGFTPAPNDPDLTFNPRGLPCVYASGTCTTAAGFAFYFTGRGSLGGNGWAAVSVSPAGRVKVWVWSGSDWGT